MKSLEKYVNAKKKLIVENEKTTDNEKYISKLKRKLCQSKLELDLNENGIENSKPSIA